jgi:hypothetical protein
LALTRKRSEAPHARGYRKAHGWRCGVFCDIGAARDLR